MLHETKQFIELLLYIYFLSNNVIDKNDTVMKNKKNI